MTLRVVAVALFAMAVLVACGGSSKRTSLAPAPTSPDAAQTPDARLNEAVDLAVRLGVMTQDEATCVFRDHPSVLQEFAQALGIGTTAAITDDVARQRAQDLIRRDAVQIDRCLSITGG